LPVETEILAALDSVDIRPCVTVPCKLLAPLIRALEMVPERELMYVAREEEGLGICAGAYLAGCFPILICQNSGLGNLVNAYCSLNQFFDVPVFFLISHRGTEGERVAAQRPMGRITPALLDIMGVEHFTLANPEQATEIRGHLEAYRTARRSRALLLPHSFWR